MKTLNLQKFGINGSISQLDLRQESNKFALNYTKNITHQMIDQLIAGVGRNVVWSWGMAGLVGLCYEARDSNGEQTALIPELIFHVQGILLPDGYVHIVYDEGNDTYIVITTDKAGTIMQSATDVYCESLGNVIDSFVERDPSWTDDEYLQRANAATVAQGMPPIVNENKEPVI